MRSLNLRISKLVRGRTLAMNARLHRTCPLKHRSSNPHSRKTLVLKRSFICCSEVCRLFFRLPLLPNPAVLVGINRMLIFVFLRTHQAATLYTLAYCNKKIKKKIQLHTACPARYPAKSELFPLPSPPKSQKPKFVHGSTTTKTNERLTGDMETGSTSAPLPVCLVG